MSFGPEYTKINTVFKRTDKGLIIPGEFSLPEYEYLLHNPWRWTEKVDGTNIRLHFEEDGSAITMGGRTDNAQLPAQLVENLRDYMNIQRWVHEGISPGTTIYGEGYGAKIQKGGGNYGPDQKFIVFDVRVGNWWLRWDDVANVAGKLGFHYIPEYNDYHFSLEVAIDMVAQGLVRSAWTGVIAEGLVGTPVVPLSDRSGHRIITKVKVKDFEDLARRG